jgi:hypothetical protein
VIAAEPLPAIDEAPPAAIPVPKSTPPPSPREAPKVIPDGYGSLTVLCMPKCDSTIDNGVMLGPGHIFNRPVEPGHHEVILHAPNGVTKTIEVDIGPERAREIRVPMESATSMTRPRPDNSDHVDRGF